MDSFSRALAQLDPASRALLDLSLRRGMRPEEIGDLLGTDPESVIVAREQALEQLASHLDLADAGEIDDVRARLAELPSEAWTGPTAKPEPTAQPREPVRERQHVPAEKRRSRLPLLLTLLAVTAIALIVVFATNGQSDQAPAHKSVPHAARPATKISAARLSNITPTAAAATATAALTDGGKRLTLDVKGLPTPHGGASYQVWLYNDVIDSQSLGSAPSGDFRVVLKLPANASHYRDVDVTLEPNDGNPNHSGVSVLRVPLSKLSS